MSKNRGICAAHTCIPQYREYPSRGEIPVKSLKVDITYEGVYRGNNDVNELELCEI